MDLLQAELQAKALMHEHGLIQQGWKFDWNNRKRALGTCSSRRKTIWLSKVYTKQLPESEVRDTILHEIAHALVGCHNHHNHIWRRKAMEIGCSGSRCADFRDKGIEVEIKGKYKAECKHCGKVYYGHKRRKRSSSCPCHGTGRYQESHKLKFVQQY
jgi:predicted SprT family Zn-dependent metalloprotease